MSPPNPTPPGRGRGPAPDGRRRTVTGGPPTDRVRPPRDDLAAPRRSPARRADDRPPLRRLRPDPRNTRVRFDRLERLLGNEGGRTRSSASACAEPSVDGGRRRSDDAPPVHWGALCTPLVLSCGYGLLAIAAGTNPLDASAPGWSRAVAFGLLGTLLLDAGWATARLYEDARWCVAQPFAWNPNPITYVLAGTLVLTAGYLSASPLLEGGTVRPGRYLVGALVAALAFSSIVSGPLYALQRRRYVAE